MNEKTERLNAVITSLNALRDAEIKEVKDEAEERIAVINKSINAAILKIEQEIGLENNKGL